MKIGTLVIPSPRKGYKLLVAYSYSLGSPATLEYPGDDPELAITSCHLLVGNAQIDLEACGFCADWDMYESIEDEVWDHIRAQNLSEED